MMNNLSMLGKKPPAPDKEDPITKAVKGGGNGNGGNGGGKGLLGDYVFAQAMPGQLGLLSGQLAAGFGGPNSSKADFRQHLQNTYSPMVIDKPVFGLGQLGKSGMDGKGAFEPDKQQMAMIAQYDQMRNIDGGGGWVKAQQLWQTMPKELRDYYTNTYTQQQG